MEEKSEYINKRKKLSDKSRETKKGNFKEYTNFMYINNSI